MAVPCKDCATRYVGCHGKCQAYKVYVVKQDAIKANKTSAHRLDDDIRHVRRSKGAYKYGY